MNTAEHRGSIGYKESYPAKGLIHRLGVVAEGDDILITLIGGEKMAVETKVLTAHVPLGLAEKVEAVASRLERSRGWVMKQALAAWVDQEEERHKMTLEALEDVDGDRVIDHQAVQAWADSLGTAAVAGDIIQVQP
jgi:predicted transcriptional regulator